MMYTLYYDSKCPVCSAFARILKNKLNSNKIQIVPLLDNSNDFKLKVPRGDIFVGKSAIDILLKDFPEIKSFYWMLPESFRGGAVKATISVASKVRNITNKITRRPCNCGKKR